MAKAKLTKKEQEVLYSAIETYTVLILAREKLEINRRNLNLLIRQVETDKVRLDRGQITITDLSQSESSLAGAQAQFTQASNDLLISKLNYENIVGSSPNPNKLKKNLKAIVNIPRAIFSFKSLKIRLSNISNSIGEYTVYGLKVIMKIMHKDSMQVFDNNEFDKNAWYMAISNHQSWADIFILLVAAHKRIPLLKFFMKKELAWIPFIFLANKTLNMPLKCIVNINIVIINLIKMC